MKRLPLAEQYKATAAYSYTAKKEDELSFKKGTVLLIEGSDAQAAWLLGRLEEQEGPCKLVPGNYVKRVGGERAPLDDEVIRLRAEVERLKADRDEQVEGLRGQLAEQSQFDSVRMEKLQSALKANAELRLAIEKIIEGNKAFLQ